MQKNNLEEYKLIRAEMLNLKDCVTTYMGYVVGGSGLAVFGLAAIGATKPNFLAFISLVLSLIISLVLIVLFYKFTSHNRFAGYSYLLNVERFSETPDNDLEDTQFLSWELCMEQLRESDTNSKKFEKLSGSIKIEFEKGAKEKLFCVINRFSPGKPNVDKGKIWKGIGHLFLALCGKVKTNSWAFPSYVVALFYVLVVAFNISGIYGLAKFWLETKIVTHEMITLWIVSGLLIVIQIYLWLSFCGKLHTLMAGTATVEGFFWRFMPIRTSYLNGFDVTPFYLGAQERLEELMKNAEINIPSITK